MSTKTTLIIAGLIALGYLINYLYRLPKFNVGEQTKNFTATLKNGSTFELNELKGKYVLLDFWGSWCGPCRLENPSLVKIYNTYAQKQIQGKYGFDIVSVAIETKKENWIRAIEQDGLNWPNHIGEFERFSSPIAKLYGVREIPTKYLLNPDGEIIMVNPTFEALEAFLSQ